MKIAYIVAIGLLVIVAIVFACNVLLTSNELHPQLDDALQGLGIFVALITGIIALAASNPKSKKVKTNIILNIEDKNGTEYEKAMLSDAIRLQFTNYDDPIVSHKIDFTLQNTSGFTLKRPTLTFRLPKDRKHPVSVKQGNIERTDYHSNLYNNPAEIVTLEFLDSIVLSNSNLPYWNDKDPVTIWIRMAIASKHKFRIEVSVNCDNAEGLTREIEIDPAKLLA